MKALAVLDIDGTLCKSPKVRTKNGDPDFAGWQRRIQTAGIRIPAVERSQSYVKQILAADIPIALVTARHQKLEDVTRSWLKHHFPEIYQAHMLMRETSLDSGRLRTHQIRSLAEEYTGCDLLVMDDKPVRVSLCQVRTFRAPADWDGMISACYLYRETIST